MFVVLALVQLHMDIETKVYSDHQAREAYIQKRVEIAKMIKNHFNVTVPENAEDLYFSNCGFLMGYEQYAAFRLDSEDECLAFFEQEKVDISKFQKCKLSPEVPWSRYNMPHNWEEKLQDSNWRLSDGGEVSYVNGMMSYVHGMIYVSDEHRIYLFWEAGP